MLQEVWTSYLGVVPCSAAARVRAHSISKFDPPPPPHSFKMEGSAALIQPLAIDITCRRLITVPAICIDAITSVIVFNISGGTLFGGPALEDRLNNFALALSLVLYIFIHSCTVVLENLYFLISYFSLKCFTADVAPCLLAYCQLPFSWTAV